jgi:hypothetical protein
MNALYFEETLSILIYRNALEFCFLISVNFESVNSIIRLFQIKFEINRDHIQLVEYMLNSQMNLIKMNIFDSFLLEKEEKTQTLNTSCQICKKLTAI